MPGCKYPDGLPDLVHLIDYNVVSDHELSQTRIYGLREAPTQ